jgi:hypothetical protein
MRDPRYVLRRETWFTRGGEEAKLLALIDREAYAGGDRRVFIQRWHRRGGLAVLVLQLDNPLPV